MDSANGTKSAKTRTGSSTPAGKRSRSGCLTCRRRKKKCDETLCPDTGGCWRCHNAGYQCEGFRRPPAVFQPKSSTKSQYQSQSELSTQHSPPFAQPLTSPPPPISTSPAHTAASESLSPTQSFPATLPFVPTPTQDVPAPAPAQTPAPLSLQNPIRMDMDPHTNGHGLPPTTQPQIKTEPYGPCEIVGDCLFSGRHLCSACSATASRLIGSETTTPSATGSAIPSHSTAALDQRALGLSSTLLPAQQLSSTPLPSLSAEKRSQLVMEGLIGYYSTLITCWIEGCDAKGLEGSALFPRLLNFLLQHTQNVAPLRLSVAAVTATYVGGARLQWPPDVTAVHQWAWTLRHDRANLTDWVRGSLTIPTSSSPPFEASPNDTTSSASSHHAMGIGAASSASPKRKRKSLHATLDDLLVGQAQTLKYLSICSLEEQINSYVTFQATEKRPIQTEDEFLSEVARANLLLMSAVNLAIYAFAEECVDSFHSQVERMHHLVQTLLGPLPPANLSRLNKLEHIGFRAYIIADLSMAIATGAKPRVTLRLGHSKPTPTPAAPDADAVFDTPFSAPDPILLGLSEIARLRHEVDGGTYRERKSTDLPEWATDRARRIEVSLRSCRIVRKGRSGSSLCADMLRHAALIFLYTTVWRVGALHPVCRDALREILALWPPAEAYCRSVGCSNFGIPIFLAATVAVDRTDRAVCKAAMHLVGHEEAATAEGRELVQELWRRTDSSGLPAFWTDLVAEGKYQVGFF